MEELIERVSAILDSPVLHYTKHKTYRQVSILFLAYLFIFSSLVFGEDEIPVFKPYENKMNKDQKILKPSNNAGNRYLKQTKILKSLKRSAESMVEVEKLFNNLESSIKELASIKPDNEEDEESLLKAFANLDGIISYAYSQMKDGKDQLESIRPQTQEEISEYNSLKIKFMSYMKLANELKGIIAQKLANTSQRITK